MVSGDGNAVRLWSHATGRRIATLQVGGNRKSYMQVGGGGGVPGCGMWQFSLYLLSIFQTTSYLLERVLMCTIASPPSDHTHHRSWFAFALRTRGARSARADSRSEHSCPSLHAACCKACCIVRL